MVSSLPVSFSISVNQSINPLSSLVFTFALPTALARASLNTTGETAKPSSPLETRSMDLSALLSGIAASD